jgi:hypothetical protein
MQPQRRASAGRALVVEAPMKFEVSSAEAILEKL